jgi:hypothetical protein
LLSATVTSAGGTVNEGNVTFQLKNGANNVGSAVTSPTVSGGAASAQYTLPAGTVAGAYTIVATYAGAIDFLDSSDNSHALLVTSPAIVLAPATAAALMSQIITVTGNSPFTNFNVSNFSSGSTGLTAGDLIPNAGAGTVVFTGTPSSAGTCTFSVNVTDSNNVSISQSYLLTVNPALSIAPSALNAADAGTPARLTIAISNGTAPYAALNVTAFDAGVTGLPAGSLTENTAAGTVVLNGTPTAPGTCAFTVNVTDSAGATLSKSYTLNVNPALSIAPTTLTAVTAGKQTTQTITVSNGTTPYTALNISNFNGGSTGLTGAILATNVNAKTVILNCIPAHGGVATFTVVATDSAGATLQQNYTLQVNVVATQLTLAGVPSGVFGGNGFNVTVSAQDAGGNTDTSINGAMSMSSSDASAILPATAVLANGTGSFNATFKTGGLQTLTVSGPNGLSGKSAQADVLQIVTWKATPTVGYANPQNPYTFTLAAVAAPGDNLTYLVNFGDGTQAQGGLGTTVPVINKNQYPFTTLPSRTTKYYVTATVTDTTSGVSGMTAVGGTPPGVTLTVVSPANNQSSATQNIGQTVGPVDNPVSQVQLGLEDSAGSAVQLSIAVNSPLLAADSPYDFETYFGDLSGQDETVPGADPVHVYSHYGVYVATTTITNPTSGSSEKARLTIAVSAEDTGEIPPGLDNTADQTITAKTLSGKFDFSGNTADTLVFSGSVTAPPGFDFSTPRDFSIGIGNIVANATVDTHGNGMPSDANSVLKKLKLSLGKAKNGAAATVQIAATISKAGLVKMGLDTEGIVTVASDVMPGKAVARKFQVAVVLQGAAYLSLIPVEFTLAKGSKTGKVIVGK